jgi:hypothetical protein
MEVTVGPTITVKLAEAEMSGVVMFAPAVTPVGCGAPTLPSAKALLGS